MSSEFKVGLLHWSILMNRCICIRSHTVLLGIFWDDVTMRPTQLNSLFLVRVLAGNNTLIARFYNDCAHICFTKEMYALIHYDHMYQAGRQVRLSTLIENPIRKWRSGHLARKTQLLQYIQQNKFSFHFKWSSIKSHDLAEYVIYASTKLILRRMASHQSNKLNMYIPQKCHMLLTVSEEIMRTWSSSL